VAKIKTKLPNFPPHIIHVLKWKYAHMGLLEGSCGFWKYDIRIKGSKKVIHGSEKESTTVGSYIIM